MAVALSLYDVQVFCHIVTELKLACTPPKFILRSFFINCWESVDVRILMIDIYWIWPRLFRGQVGELLHASERKTRPAPRQQRHGLRPTARRLRSEEWALPPLLKAVEYFSGLNLLERVQHLLNTDLFYIKLSQELINRLRTRRSFLWDGIHWKVPCVVEYVGVTRASAYGQA